MLNRETQQIHIFSFFCYGSTIFLIWQKQNCSRNKTTLCSWWCIFGTDVTTLGHWRFHLSPGSALNRDSCYTSATISFSRVRLLQGRTMVDCGQQQLTHQLRRISTYRIPYHCTECTGLFWPLQKVRCTAARVDSRLRTDLIIPAEW